MVVITCSRLIMALLFLAVFGLAVLNRVPFRIIVSIAVLVRNRDHLTNAIPTALVAICAELAEFIVPHFYCRVRNLPLPCDLGKFASHFVGFHVLAGLAFSFPQIKVVILRCSDVMINVS